MGIFDISRIQDGFTAKSLRPVVKGSHCKPQRRQYGPLANAIIRTQDCASSEQGL